MPETGQPDSEWGYRPAQWPSRRLGPQNPPREHANARLKPLTSTDQPLHHHNPSLRNPDTGRHQRPLNGAAQSQDGLHQTLSRPEHNPLNDGRHHRHPQILSPLTLDEGAGRDS